MVKGGMVKGDIIKILLMSTCSHVIKLLQSIFDAGIVGLEVD